MVAGPTARGRLALALCALFAFASLPAAAQDAPGGVTVLKGKPAQSAAPAATGQPAAAQSSDAVVMGSGGRHMWMVDRAAGQITDCQSVQTYYSGTSRLECTTHPLPASIAPGQ